MTTVETDRNCKSKQKNWKLKNAKCIKIPNFRKLTDFGAFLGTISITALWKVSWAVGAGDHTTCSGLSWWFWMMFPSSLLMRLKTQTCYQQMQRGSRPNESIWHVFYCFLFYVNCHSIKDWNDWCAKHPLCAIQSDFQPFCFSHMFTESDFHCFMPQGGSNANAEASSNSSNISWKSERRWIEPIRSLVWQLLFGILRELANNWLEQMEKPDLSR